MLAEVVGFDHFFAKPADPAALIDVLAAHGSPPPAAA
jgi:hypothetical protein